MKFNLKYMAMIAGVGLLSACAAIPPSTQISELDEARALIAKAKQAGAERCAPERQAEAVAKLYAAAHELTEGDIHPEENESLIAASVKAAKQALGKSKARCQAEVIALSGVYFETNSAKLSPASDATLNHAVAVLKKRASIRVEVAAHTDSRGKDAYNMALSERRAKSVMDYLTAHAIAASRLTSHGYGETQAVADNATAAGRAKNRRVELRIR
ncbi:MAG: OmpA family protein [Mariprofundaceae bacterium]|nr:OmpA family protein [Mariprofundaceae bacterium]